METVSREDLRTSICLQGLPMEEKPTIIIVNIDLSISNLLRHKKDKSSGRKKKTQISVG